jgi:hypothetical protein
MIESILIIVSAAIVTFITVDAILWALSSRKKGDDCTIELTSCGWTKTHKRTKK